MLSVTTSTRWIVQYHIHFAPLLFELINSPAMVRRCMEIIKRVVYFLNPGQGGIITGDQPAYALRKKVHWMYLSHYSDIERMMGSFHTEMVFLSAIGYWLAGCTWTDPLDQAKINAPWRVESLLDRGKVTISPAIRNTTHCFLQRVCTWC